jgi:hypothetical protein|nr:hypothetical protein [Bradyrhizobium sp.]
MSASRLGKKDADRFIAQVRETMAAEEPDKDENQPGPAVRDAGHAVREAD